MNTLGNVTKYDTGNSKIHIKPYARHICMCKTIQSHKELDANNGLAYGRVPPCQNEGFDRYISF